MRARILGNRSEKRIYMVQISKHGNAHSFV